MMNRRSYRAGARDPSRLPANSKRAAECPAALDIWRLFRERLLPPVSKPHRWLCPVCGAIDP